MLFWSHTCELAEQGPTDVYSNPEIHDWLVLRRGSFYSWNRTFFFLFNLASFALILIISVQHFFLDPNIRRLLWGFALWGRHHGWGWERWKVKLWTYAIAASGGGWGQDRIKLHISILAEASWERRHWNVPTPIHRKPPLISLKQAQVDSVRWPVMMVKFST